MVRNAVRNSKWSSPVSGATKTLMRIPLQMGKIVELIIKARDHLSLSVNLSTGILTPIRKMDVFPHTPLNANILLKDNNREILILAES